MKKCMVTIPGDNSHTAEDMIKILSKVPGDAKIRTKRGPLDPEILIWLEEEI